MLISFKRQHRRYENRFFFMVYPISVTIYLQKKTHQNFVLLAKHYFFWQKKNNIWILLITFKRQHRRYENRLFHRSIPSQQRFIYKKTTKIRFASKKKKKISGKKFDFRILLITSKTHHRRYENRLFYRSIPSQYRINNKKHPYFVLLAKYYYF